MKKEYLILIIILLLVVGTPVWALFAALAFWIALDD